MASSTIFLLATLPSLATTSIYQLCLNSATSVSSLYTTCGLFHHSVSSQMPKHSSPRTAPQPLNTPQPCPSPNTHALDPCTSWKDPKLLSQIYIPEAEDLVKQITGARMSLQSYCYCAAYSGPKMRSQHTQGIEKRSHKSNRD
jgi:hypothetical protein